MHVRFVLLLAVVILLLPQGSSALVIGANVHIAQRYTPSEDVGLAAALATYEVPWAREEFYWNGIETTQGTFDWAATDRAVAIYRQQGTKVLGLLAYSAAWASTNQTAPDMNDRIFAPPQLEAWKAYVAAVVTRYHDRVQAWEVWNEPDLPGFFRTSAGAAAYVPLLQAAYTTIKAIDPTATVVSAGTAGVNTAFIKKMYQNGARGYLDAVGVHPYRILGNSFANSPGHSAFGMQTMTADLAALRTVIDRYDPGRAVWATEFGWPTFSGGVTEIQQAAYLEQAAVILLAYGVDVAFWYGFRNDGTADAQEQTFGLLHHDYTPKPVAAVFTRLNEDYRGTTFVRWEGFPAVSPIAFRTAKGWAVERWDGGRMLRRTDVTPATVRSSPTGGQAVTIPYDFRNGQGSRFSYLTGPFARTFSSTLELWYEGDGSMHDLRLRFIDAKGETFQLTLGPIAKGWQRVGVDLRSATNRMSSWGKGANGKVDRPIIVLGVIIDGSANRGLRSQGKVKLGTVRTLAAPFATAARLEQDGVSRWVAWADGPAAAVNVRTPVARTLALTQAGQSSTTTPAGGRVVLPLGVSPVTVR